MEPASDPRLCPPWRSPTATEVLRTLAGWGWTFAIFLMAPILSLVSLGLFGPRLTTWLAHTWGPTCCRLLGVQVEVSGLEHLRHPGSRIVVANHTSALDMPLVAMVAPTAPLVLAKAELRWVFPFNLMWVALGQRFVERTNKGQARASVDALVAALGREERSIVLAPEGTRSRSGELGRFKLGAFYMAAQTHVPMVPVLIRGAGPLMPPGRWWIQAGRCVVEIKPPIDTSAWVPEQVHTYAEALEADYRRWLAEGGPVAPAPRPAAGAE